MTVEIVEDYENQSKLVIGKVTTLKSCETHCDEYDEKYNGMRRDVRSNRWVRFFEEAFRKLTASRCVVEIEGSEYDLYNTFFVLT